MFFLHCVPLIKLLRHGRVAGLLVLAIFLGSQLASQAASSSFLVNRQPAAGFISIGSAKPPATRPCVVLQGRSTQPATVAVSPKKKMKKTATCRFAKYTAIAMSQCRRYGDVNENPKFHRTKEFLNSQLKNLFKHVGFDFHFDFSFKREKFRQHILFLRQIRHKFVTNNNI